MLFVFGKLHWQFSVRFTGYVYRPPLDRGSGLRAGVSKSEPQQPHTPRSHQPCLSYVGSGGGGVKWD